MSLWSAAPLWAQAVEAPTFTVVAASAFLRDEPRIQSPANYSVFQGQTFIILGRNSNNSWLQLDYPKATKGTWILASLGTVTGDMSSIPVTAISGASGSAVTPTSTLPPIRIVTATPPGAVAGPSEICVLLYNDVNGNGSPEANEGSITGGQLTLLDSQSGAVLQTYTTTSRDTQGHCFPDLPAGTYTVAAAAPAGYNATTDASVLQTMQGGEHFVLTFGAQPGAAGGNASNQLTLWSIVGMICLLVAAGAMAYLLMRRR